MIDQINDVYSRFLRFNGEEKYVIDKVLGSYIDNESMLKSDKVKIVFLLRAPEASLPSMLNVGVDLVSTEEGALRYYQERLDVMMRYADSLSDTSKSFFLTYEDLIDRSTYALSELTDFLELEEKLSTEYETMWATGRRVYGDQSPNIKRGTIVRKKKTPTSQVTEKVLKEARSSYEQCHSHLVGNCWSI